ncbi:MAG: hypothetical protein IKE62_02695 [Oscillospiraceae bacterium]|nr:hypothetical protein [Oscillospiraceae bacterium]
MKRTLYSLMLNDDVVREIDRQAHRIGTNRSNLVNQILAEYVSVMTPEKRINDIFGAIEELLRPDRDIVPFFVPNQQTMSLKSSLEYKYRPTVKYEVQIYSGDGLAMGELSVIYRTQSSALITALTEFFRLIKQIESRRLAPLMKGAVIKYALYEGRFVRSIQMNRDRNYTSDDIAQAISGYIKFFDTMLKGFLSGRYSPEDVDARYEEYLAGGNILL